MGKKSTKTVQTADPWKPAQPYILEGMKQTQRVFDENQPQLDKYSKLAFDNYGQLNPGAVSGIAGSQGLVNDTLGGKYLMGNPYLDAVIGRSAADIADGVNSQFTMAGRYGSGAHGGVLAREIGDMSNRLRMGNYDAERQRQMQAVGQAQDLMRGSQGLLEQAATLPWTGVAAQTGNIRQASNGYGTTTTNTVTRDPWGTAVGFAGAGATAASAGAASDPRVKTNVKPLGQTAPNGSPLYEFDNMASGRHEIGVMADEVPPEARGADLPGGIASVHYPLTGMPGPIDMGPAQSKSIPDEQLKPQKRKFFDALVNPDANTTAGKIGLLGQAMMAGSGSAFAPLGQGLMNLGQQQRDDAQEQHDRAIEARRMAAYEAAIAARNAPEPVEDPAALRNYNAWRNLPENEREAARPFFGGAQYDPNLRSMMTDEQIRAARGRAEAAAANRAPPGGGGGRISARKQIGGVQYVKIGNDWFER